jgi:hypothetical protein
VGLIWFGLVPRGKGFSNKLSLLRLLHDGGRAGELEHRGGGVLRGVVEVLGFLGVEVHGSEGDEGREGGFGDGGDGAGHFEMGLIWGRGRWRMDGEEVGMWTRCGVVWFDVMRCAWVNECVCKKRRDRTERTTRYTFWCARDKKNLKR